MQGLTILRAGETGTGYLIEQDAGYISPTDERNLPFINELNKLGSAPKTTIVIAEPLKVVAVLQKYGIENRNGRVYPEAILRTQAEEYQKLVVDRRALGELDHPESSIISGKDISHNITKIWWEGATLMGELEIIMSPGFINLGIISCQGDMVGNLLRHGIKIGVSSRGVGSVEDFNGIQLVQNDFELICWDIVTNPSTPGSWVFKNNKEAGAFKESVEPNRLIDISTGLDTYLIG